MTQPAEPALVTDEPGPQWRPDVLSGFERLTVGLDVDAQGQNIVTLIRSARSARSARSPGMTPGLPRRALLAIHGWSDYFYNDRLARAAEEAGYAFYAVDLRHYGRSLRPGQTPGWTDDLRRYDADIEAALAVITREHPDPPVVEAHSTGGLIVALWAHRNPGRLAALVLNSPWLRTHGNVPGRLLAGTVVRPVSAVDPYAMLKVPRIDHYWRTLSSEADGEWDLHPLWRPRWAFDVPAAWLAAVLAGHREVARGLDIQEPVLVHVAGRGHRGARYADAALEADIVLEPRATARHALRLGDAVMVQRHPGALHDVFASAPQVRRGAWKATVRWLDAYAPPSPAEGPPADPVLDPAASACPDAASGDGASTAPPNRRSRRA